MIHIWLFCGYLLFTPMLSHHAKILFGVQSNSGQYCPMVKITRIRRQAPQWRKGFSDFLSGDEQRSMGTNSIVAEIRGRPRHCG